jgi:hypothetical protein
VVLLPILPRGTAGTLMHRYHVVEDTLVRSRVEQQAGSLTLKFGSIFNPAESCSAQSGVAICGNAGRLHQIAKHDRDIAALAGGPANHPCTVSRVFGQR